MTSAFLMRLVRGAPYALVAATVVAMTLYSHSVKWLDLDGADYRFYPPFMKYNNRHMTDHLGAEYLSIAKAIRAGRGFSDPFRTESGPTAWMPPILPYLQAGILEATDGHLTRTVYCVVTLQSLTLILTGCMVVAAARRALGHWGWGWAAALVYIAELCQEFQSAFQMTHDSWLQLLLFDLLLIGFARLPDAPARGPALRWGALGGFAALGGPVLGIVWASLTAVAWPPLRPAARRGWLFGVLAAALVLAPWTLRNAAVFGKFIPVKSNAFYELYQQQVESRDGLLRSGGAFETHPYKAGPSRDHYVRVGEQAFLAEKRAEFLKTFWAAPDDFAVRAWNRFVAAAMVPYPYDRWYDKLEVDFWKGFTLLMQPLPLAALVGLALSPRRWHRYEVAAAAAWTAWLLPYVAVSYYDRYGFPLLGVKAFLIVAAASRLLPARRAEPSERGASAP